MQQKENYTVAWRYENFSSRVENISRASAAIFQHSRGHVIYPLLKQHFPKTLRLILTRKTAIENSIFVSFRSTSF